LLNIGTSGKLTILFPNKLYQSNRISPDRLYAIPGPEYPFEYQLTGPSGTERLKGIATLFDVPLLPSDFDPGGGFFKTVSASAAPRDIAIVEKRAGGIPEQEIAIAESSFEVG
jgi:hypothetical protein